MNATVRRVDGVEHRGALDVLQRLALPCDKPADTRRGFWWVAEVRGEPAAFAGMYPSAQWGDAFYLCRAGVLPEFRGQGLQKRLIRARGVRPPGRRPLAHHGHDGQPAEREQPGVLRLPALRTGPTVGQQPGAILAQGAVKRSKTPLFHGSAGEGDRP